jgi:hypothetical protein
MSQVDTFVIYRDIEFSKGSWVNRNKLILGGKPDWFTIPLEKSGDYTMISERKISKSWPQIRESQLRKIELNYRQAEHFAEASPWISKVFQFNTSSLSDFLWHSIFETRNLLNINTRIIEENDIGNFRHLKGQERVLAVCKELGATRYINPPGGKGLYSEPYFTSQGVQLEFQEITKVHSVSEIGNLGPLSIIDSVANFGPKSISRSLSKVC